MKAWKEKVHTLINKHKKRIVLSLSIIAVFVLFFWMISEGEILYDNWEPHMHMPGNADPQSFYTDSSVIVFQMKISELIPDRNECSFEFQASSRFPLTSLEALYLPHSNGSISSEELRLSQNLLTNADTDLVFSFLSGMDSWSLENRLPYHYHGYVIYPLSNEYSPFMFPFNKAVLRFSLSPDPLAQYLLYAVTEDTRTAFNYFLVYDWRSPTKSTPESYVNGSRIEIQFKTPLYYKILFVCGVLIIVGFLVSILFNQSVGVIGAIGTILGLQLFFPRPENVSSVMFPDVVFLILMMITAILVLFKTLEDK